MNPLGGLGPNLAYFILRFGETAVSAPDAPLVLDKGLLADLSEACRRHVNDQAKQVAREVLRREGGEHETLRGRTYQREPSISPFYPTHGGMYQNFHAAKSRIIPAFDPKIQVRVHCSVPQRLFFGFSDRFGPIVSTALLLRVFMEHWTINDTDELLRRVHLHELWFGSVIFRL